MTLKTRVVVFKNRFNLTHPEKRKDEVFYSNADDDYYRQLNFTTKRYGHTAYNNEGKEYSNFDKREGSFPVFVKKSEILERSGKEALRKLEEGD